MSTKINGDRPPPHSIEAEQGVLSCVLQSPALLADCPPAEDFYDLRHQVIIQAARSVKNLDAFTLRQRLHDSGQLDDVGGDAYLAQISEAAPSPANLPNYLDTMREKTERRRIITTAGELVEMAHSYDGDMEDFQWAAQSTLGNLFSGRIETREQSWSIRGLNAFDATNDPAALIGYRDGRTTRFLCRGYGAWLIGPSGIGKSSLVSQAAFSWALGISLFGITPIRPLRILIVQAENDEGDAAEMTQGILQSFGIGEFDRPEMLSELNDRIRIMTERRLVGERFCAWLGKQIELHHADIVFADPFLSFAGLDVNRQDQCTKFLRQSLNPVLADTGACLFAAHHTGKPKDQKTMKGWTATDYAYQGIGSSELVNWARAVMVLLPLADGQHYELKLAKRGSRAGACHPDGEPTTSIYLRHALDRIFWEQVDPPAAPEEEKGEPRKGGKPSKVHEICSMNLYEFCAGCTTEGEGKKEIARRLESWLATQKMDVSIDTCRRAVMRLVETGKLTKTSASTYAKGPNA